MKNLSVSKKLYIGFGAILAMLLVTIGMSIYSISGINGQIHSYAKYTLPNSASIWILRRNTVSVQRDLSSALAETDTQKISKWLELAQQDSQLLLSELDVYAGNQRDTSRDEGIAQLRELFGKAAVVRQEIEQRLQTPTESNVQQAKETYEDVYVPYMDQAAAILVGFTTTADERAARQEQDAVVSVQLAWVILALCGAAAIALSAVLTVIIRRWETITALLPACFSCNIALSVVAEG